MIPCFIAGNLWLLAALLLFVERTFERDSPTRYSVFHGRQWFSPETYALIILAVLAVSASFFFQLGAPANTHD